MKSCPTATADATTPTREELELYMPLVHQIVARVMRKVPPNVLREDLTSAGSLGLVSALRKNTERGSAFDWYARIRIRGAVVDELRAQDWLSRRQRTRVTRAKAEGTGGGAAIVRFDDLSEGQAGAFADESSGTPEEQAGLRLDRRILQHAVGRLPEREGNIVAWHYFEDASFKSIATRLGVSEPRVSQLHSRAIGFLRARMTEQSGAEAA
jgi:RNA polymerase sigma factor for flagellar operon FliA